VRHDAVLDQAQLASLAAHLPTENVQQLIDLFLAQIDAQIPSIEALSQGDDLAALAHVAHSLAGAASNIGALGLTRLVREIEAACKSADLEAVAQLAGCLQAVAKATSVGFRDWLAAADGCSRLAPRRTTSPRGASRGRRPRTVRA